MMCRSLSAILLATFIGCSRGDEGGPPQETVAGSKSAASEDRDTAKNADSERSKPATPSDGARRIEIELPGKPPTDDPVEPGTYVLSIRIALDNGGSVEDRYACTVEIEGETVTLLVDRSKGDPFIGTLENGRLVVKPRAGEATYGLEGQVVGPGQLRGKVVAGANLKGVRIVDGRWALDRVK